MKTGKFYLLVSYSVDIARRQAGCEKTMKVKWFLFLLTILFFLLLVLSFSDFYKKEDQTKKVGVLLMGDSREEKYQGLRDGLTDAGFQQNQLMYVVKNAHDQSTVLESSIKKLLAENPDVIVTLGAIETIELKSELSKKDINIPVVFAGMADPIDFGVIKDYSSSSTNFTGINNYHTSMSAKRLELLQELVPNLKRVHIIYDKTIEASIRGLNETKKAAKILNITLIPWDVNNQKYKMKMKEVKQESDAIMTLSSFRLESQTKEIAELSRETQMPVMGISKHEVELGFLASYGTSFYEQGKQSARFVSAILQGNSPTRLPVELPDNIRLMVNKRVAEQLNIRLNQETLHIAEYVHSVQSSLEGEKSR